MKINWAELEMIVDRIKNLPSISSEGLKVERKKTILSKNSGYTPHPSTEDFCGVKFEAAASNDQNKR